MGEILENIGIIAVGLFFLGYVGLLAYAGLQLHFERRFVKNAVGTRRITDSRRRVYYVIPWAQADRQSWLKHRKWLETHPFGDDEPYMEIWREGKSQTWSSSWKDIHLPTVLVIDDRDLTRFLIGEAIGREFHSVAVSHAADREEASQRIAEERPDLVILNVVSDRTRSQVLTDIRAKAGDVPVLVISGSAIDEGRGAESLDGQSVSFIEDPIKADELLNEVARVLGLR